jgi:prepilin-type N-terminal cleavage/methylation domain-containing protein
MLDKLKTKRAGFTLVEIMIVVAIIALLAAIAVPNFLRSRKRSQATQILEDLRIIDAAIDLYAIEFNRPGTSSYSGPDLQKYVKNGTRLYDTLGTAAPKDMLGNNFSGTALIDGSPRSTVSPTTFAALSDVAPREFWSPFID